MVPLRFFNLPRTRVRALISLLTLCCGLSLNAQDLTSPLLSDSWQATFSNPALYGRARSRLTVGLPGLTNDLYVENLSYNQLVTDEDGRRILNLSAVPDLLANRNELRNDSSVETIGVGMKGDRFAVGLYHRARLSGRIDYPKTLVELAARGNAAFIGQTVEVAPLGQLTSYHEIGLGASVAITPKIHLGGRIKYLSGIADLRTAAGGSLQLTTGTENYALTLDQELTVNSAGSLNYESLDDIDFNYDLNRISTDKLFSGNNGLAFDLGLFGDFDKLRVQLAATDLGGRIEWTNEVTNLRFTGSDTFSGLDILDRVFEDSLSLSSAVDSVKLTFEPGEDGNAYTSNLAATYLVGGEYDVTDRLTAGLLIVHFARPVNPETAVAVSARYRVIDAVTVGLNYNARKGAPFNLGGHLYARLGPVNLLASTDNLLTVFNQKNNSRASFRLGAFLSIGKIIERERE